MVPSINDGLCTEMVLVYILKTQAAYMTFSGQQLLEPLADLLVPPLEPVTGNVVEAVVMDVHVKGEIFPQHMNRAQCRTLRFVLDDAHLFIRHRLVRQRVLNEVSPDKLAKIVPMAVGYAHQFLQLRVREQHVANDVVHIVVPGALLLHELFTVTFP